MTEIIDNRAFRIRTMKEIIRHLHEGGEPDEVRSRLKELVRETDSSEIAAMEQQLIGEGMPVEQVQSMCDLHSSVLQEILVEPERPKVLHGHPIDTFQRENEAIRQVVAQLRGCLAGLASRDPSSRLLPISSPCARRPTGSWTSTSIIVEQILDDFRSGRQYVAEFWIESQGKFIHIRYFAVRDENGKYAGTLEVTQDLTRLRSLQGERRLLQYGN